ncbi:MAG TPA: hypothetical protein VKQ31_12450 [Steroidobacteraceae bacterium]|nr:hypothetical protein [Steroidobacteraceae bacterium]
MTFDRKYLIWALGYAVAGMCVGLYMAASENHAEFVAHAHILLIGFAVSFFYGIIHKLWLPQPRKTVARVQFIVHQVATFGVSVGLLLVYGGAVPEATIGPYVGVAAAGVLAGMLLMMYMVISARPSPA